MSLDGTYIVSAPACPARRVYALGGEIRGQSVGRRRGLRSEEWLGHLDSSV